MEQGIIMFAQADLSAAPADQFKWTIIIIIGLLLVGLQIWTATRQNKTIITPDPLRIEKLDKFATRAFVDERDREHTRRFDQHERELVSLRSDAKADRERNEVHASARGETIYRKIEGVRLELSEKIDSTPERVIATLSTLGLLRKPGEDE